MHASIEDNTEFAFRYCVPIQFISKLSFRASPEFILDLYLPSWFDYRRGSFSFSLLEGVCFFSFLCWVYPAQLPEFTVCGITPPYLEKQYKREAVLSFTSILIFAW